MTSRENRLCVETPSGRRLRTLSIALLVLLSIVPVRSVRGAVRIDHEAECTYKRLTWDDFRGPVVNGQQGAWISAMVILEPVLIDMVDRDGGGAIARVRNPIVYALMNKLASGARPGGRTDANLAHEQIHFDLTEVVARRLWRELGQLQLEGEERSEALQRRLLLDVERRYAEALGELQWLQGSYDGETGNGTRGGAQKKWAQRAAALLAAEAAYELR